ncbi:MAG TPA: hypothetical protein VMB21_18855 [Candidatus Limnocylindria bacterium]|jgi:hypothetical protein|nr:hypothetical protein [Candidatus Limnocylindria bacterium]
MDPSVIDRWLRRRFQREANVCVALSPLAILGGLLVLFLTFWFAYAAAYLGGQTVNAVISIFTNGHFKLRHVTRLWLAGGFLVALIIGYWRTKPFHFSEPSEFGTLSPLEQQLATYAEAGGIAGAAGLHGGSPFTLLLFPQASSRMITDLLFTGPRLLFGGWGLLRQSARLRTVDTAGPAEILAVLAARDGQVTNEEIVTLWPGLNFAGTMRALQLLPGVVTLELGLSLTAELRGELRALR